MISPFKSMIFPFKLMISPFKLMICSGILPRVRTGSTRNCAIIFNTNVIISTIKFIISTIKFISFTIKFIIFSTENVTVSKNGFLITSFLSYINYSEMMFNYSEMMFNYSEMMLSAQVLAFEEHMAHIVAKFSTYERKVTKSRVQVSFRSNRNEDPSIENENSWTENHGFCFSKI